MRLKLNQNGGVDFVLMAGTAKVKSTMLSSEAQQLIQSGKVQKKGNQVVVNDKFIFELDTEDDVAIEEPKEETLPEANEDKPLSEAVKETKSITRKPRKKAKK